MQRIFADVPKKKLIRGEPHNSWLDQLKLKNQIDLITW